MLKWTFQILAVEAISLCRGAGVGRFANKYWLGALEVCHANLCDGFSPSKQDSFVCLPPTISFENLIKSMILPCLTTWDILADG